MRRLQLQIMAAALLGFAAARADGQVQPEQGRTSEQTTTIIGCLVRDPSTSAEEFLVRTAAIAVPAGTQVSVGGSGSATSGGRATTSAGTPAATTNYRITGLTVAELKPHVGHRIELQGRLSNNAPPATTATTTQNPKTGRATTTVKEDWTIAGVLHATAMKMVAANCQ
jgi:hypothetical protein